MKKTTLVDGTRIYCIAPTEGQMLYEHITGYLEHGSISVKDGDTIVDVGANIGVLGIKLSNMFNNISILSFEPLPETFNVLKKNASLTQNKQFKVFQWGISDKNEVLDFTYYPNSPAMSTSNPDIWDSDKDLLDALEGNLENAPSNWWWAKYIPKILYPYIVKRLRKNPKIISCQLKSLSQSIQDCKIDKINLLKIDCEGNELKVLNGIKDPDWDIIDQIVVEVHDIDGSLDYVKKLLNAKSYKVDVIKEPSMQKTSLYNVYAYR